MRKISNYRYFDYSSKIFPSFIDIKDMRFLKFVYVCSILLISSCNDSFEEGVGKIQIGSFQINLISSSDSSISINWSEPKKSNLTDPITYSVYLDDKIKVEGYSNRNYTFSNLKSGTEYIISVEAQNDNSSVKVDTVVSTSIRTFIKRYKSGTEVNFHKDIEDGFLIARINKKDPNDFKSELVKINYEGDVEWEKTYRPFKPYGYRTIKSIDSDGLNYFINVTEWGDNGNYVVLNQISKTGNDINSIIFSNPSIYTIGLSKSKNISDKHYGIYSEMRDENKYFLYKINEDGVYNPLDTSSNTQIVTDAIFDTNNNLFLLVDNTTRGGFDGIIKFNSELSHVWNKEFQSNRDYFTKKITLTETHFYIVGSVFNHNPFNILGLVLKCDLQGNIVWEKIIDAASFETLLSTITPTPDGGCIVGGSLLHNRGDQLGLFKLSSEGEMEWEREFRYYDNLEQNAVRGISLSNDGGYFIHGTSLDWINTSTESYHVLLKVDENGNWR